MAPELVAAQSNLRGQVEKTPFRLLCLTPPHHGTVLKMLPGRQREFIVGRAPGADVVVKEPAISGTHCKFIFNPDDTVVLQDLDSSNGTFVNGQRVEDGPQAVRDGDVVALGAFETVFRSPASAQGKKSFGATTGPVIDLASTPKRDTATAITLKSLSPFTHARESAIFRYFTLAAGAVLLVVLIILGLVLKNLLA